MLVDRRADGSDVSWTGSATAADDDYPEVEESPYPQRHELRRLGVDDLSGRVLRHAGIRLDDDWYR